MLDQSPHTSFASEDRTGPREAPLYFNRPWRRIYPEPALYRGAGCSGACTLTGGFHVDKAIQQDGRLQHSRQTAISSLCPSASKNDDRNSKENKLDIVAEGLMRKVFKIHFHHVLEGDARSPIYLPGSRQARFPNHA